jgi:hypothetical protein
MASTAFSRSMDSNNNVLYTFLPTDTDHDIPKLNENEREYCEGKCGL